jgi:hypothetical protein
MTYGTPMRRSGAIRGAITLGDLRGRLEVLRVACRKCDRAGRYSVEGLIERHGADAGLPDWKDTITADCPLRAQPAVWNLCGAHFPDLLALYPPNV